MNKACLRKYFIMGSQDCDRDPELVLKEALQAGITVFQYREKGKNSLVGEEMLSLAKGLRELCRVYNVPFIINDDIFLANILDVDGIHVGQEDVPVEEIKEKYPDKFIGLSISSEEELKNSPVHLIDYIGAGPIYGTTTKEDAKQAVGTQWIEKLHELHPELPIVGIGGITVENAKDVIEAGATGVAVISAITKSDNIKERVDKL